MPQAKSRRCHTVLSALCWGTAAFIALLLLTLAAWRMGAALGARPDISLRNLGQLVEQSRNGSFEPLLILNIGIFISVVAAGAIAALIINAQRAAQANRRLASDIAARDQIEEILRRSEQKYRLLFESNPQPMWLYDRETLHFLEVNETAIVKYGYSRAEFLAMRVSDIRPPEDIARFLKSTATPPGGYREAGEWRHVTRDGRIIDVEIVIHDLDFQGRPAALVCAMDITERKRTQAALKIHQLRLQAITENAPLKVALKDVHGRYLFANRKFAESYGYAPEQVVGRTTREVLPQDRAEKEVLHDAVVMRRNSPVQYELVEPAEDRPEVTLNIHFPLPGKDGAVEGVGVISADVTDQKWMENQLRQSQKMEAIGQLTGGTAHDFNNLLTVIIGNAEVLSESLDDRDDLRHLTGMILLAAERGADLTRHLLAYARRQPLQPKDINLNELVRETESLLSRSLGEDIEITIALAEDLWLATVDPTQVETALLNLAVNARDAMPKGGKLTIETDNVKLDDETTATYRFGVKTGDYVMLQVTDTGVGMTPEVVERAFEPFFTTKDFGKGSGLGLSMVYGFVKQSGGYVRIYSEPGVGTSIRLYLPRADQAAVAEVQDERAPVQLPHGKELILVVEDNDLVRESLVGRLHSLGYRTREARDAHTALDMLKEDRKPDLLFTDIVLPNGMNGQELAEQARRLIPDLKVLFTSGYTDRAISQPGAIDKGISFLNKPYQKEDLARKIREGLGQ